jgi:hypothetical protein
MILGSSVLAIFSATLIYYLAKNRSVIWQLLFTAFLAAGMASPDTQLFLYPFLVALYIYNVSVDKLNNVSFSNSKKLFCCLLFIPFGLLFLVKGSLIMLIVGITGLSTALFWHRGMRKTAITICIVPLISIVFFQLLAHQPVWGIWYYFKNMLPIVSGYTEAMSSHGDKKEIIFFLFSSLVAVIICYREKTIPLVFRMFLILSISLFLFTAFKAGFTRHDGHAIAAASSVFALGFLMYTIMQQKSLHFLFILSTCTWLFICYTYRGADVFNMIKPVQPVYIEAVDGFMLRIKGNDGLKNKYNERMNDIRKQAFKVPALKGTTDMYSYEQGYLLASENNTWSPRPIMQSYSAYNSKLAQMNEAHLTSPKAPNNIIFTMQPIDNRYPALEDGLSWPTIINNYRPDHTDTGFLFLKQKRITNISPKRKELYTIKCKVGEDVIIPDTTQALFAEFDIHKTLLGGLSSTLYKPDPIEIFVTLVDGRSFQYRFIPGMAKAGFIFSPLVYSTKEFEALVINPDSLKHKYVKSFRIKNDGLGLRSFFNTWDKEYTVHLSQVIYDK